MSAKHQAPIRLDDEFRSMIPPLRPAERVLLEANICAEGCRDPLVVWEPSGTLIDGYNRYDICAAHGIEFTVQGVVLSDREAAADWIDANQLGRRNLTPDQYSLMRGRRYNRTKKPHGGDRKSKGKNCPLNVPTAAKLAEQHGVSERTVKGDGAFAEAVAAVKEIDPQIEAKVASGKAPPKSAIIEAAKQLVPPKRKAKGKPRASGKAKDKPPVEVNGVESPPAGTRKDRDAAAVWERSPERAEAILSGKHGTVAQATKAIRDEDKRAELEAKAKAAAVANGKTKSAPTWEIIRGDCLEKLKAIEPGSARLIFADPPYNIGVDYGAGKAADRRPDWEYLAWCAEWIDQCHRALADDGSMWVLVNHEYAAIIELLLRGDVLIQYRADSEVERVFDAFGGTALSVLTGFQRLHVRAWLTWYESFGVNCKNNFSRCSRRLFYCVKNPHQFVFHPSAVTRPSDRQIKHNDRRADPGGRLWGDIWGIPWGANDEGAIPRLVGTAKERLPSFPTQLPLSLLLPIVGCASDPGDLVVDPFNGSGTTGEAAIRLGRRYVGIEASADFARMARQRLTVAQREAVRDPVQ